MSTRAAACGRRPGRPRRATGAGALVGRTNRTFTRPRRRPRGVEPVLHPRVAVREDQPYPAVVVHPDLPVVETRHPVGEVQRLQPLEHVVLHRPVGRLRLVQLDQQRLLGLEAPLGRRVHHVVGTAFGPTRRRELVDGGDLLEHGAELVPHPHAGLDPSGGPVERARQRARGQGARAGPRRPAARWTGRPDASCSQSPTNSRTLRYTASGVSGSQLPGRSGPPR